MEGTDSGEDTGRHEDASNAEHRESTEPEQHYGAENATNEPGSPALNEEQPHQDHNRDRHDEGR